MAVRGLEASPDGSSGSWVVAEVGEVAEAGEERGVAVVEGAGLP